MLFTADFETTTTNENDCRVWAWAVCEIGNTDNFTYSNTINSFFDFIENHENSTYYFHNLKFDGEFIMVYLFEHGFKHVTDRKEEASKTFRTLISDKGQFYSIKIIFEKKGKKTKYVQIFDSLKILPFRVEEIAKGFNLPISKLKIDYKTERPVGYELTPNEVDYIRNDVEIVARALKVLFDQDLTKMTQGSNALFDYKRTVTQKKFDEWFPIPDYDYDVRQAYKGGYTYLNPKYRDLDIGEGLVLDVNSLYPWVLHDCPLPFGDGIFFKGRYKPDKIYNLYVQMITCQFELKEGYLPTIQLKNNLSFIPTEYLTSSGYEEVTMCLTSVDLKLFFEHYNVYNIEYHSGWKFMSTTGLFTEYVDKWMTIKIESSLTGNKAMRTLSKLMLNALYGKFSLSPNVQSKIPFYDKGMIRYVDGEKETRDPIYIPVGAFVTAWARHKTITSAQKMYDVFVYADTDSLHLNLPLPPELSEMSNDELEELTTDDLKKYGLILPEGFEVDPVALGAWKIESRFTRARFIRQKAYIEDWNKPETWNAEKFSSGDLKEYCENNNLELSEELKKYKGFYDTDLLNITCAGMSEGCYPFVTWENFHEGATYKGKLQPKHVKGGIVLNDIDFTIQKSH